ncbi:hypothetical protein N8475_10300 [Winogradskyella sp.]|nr:hypothetical protein [Winogradskyella sp.]
MSKKILYILSGNLSTTPRAVQSLIATQNHYDVTVIGVNRSNDWLTLDAQIVRGLPINYSYVSLGRENVLSWFINSIKNKVATFLVRLWQQNLKLNAYASSKASIVLIQALQKTNVNYDVVIGHSYGSLYPAYRYAQKTKAKFIFDIEDYHPGEAGSNPKYISFVLKELLHKADVLTCAAPLISDKIQKLCILKAKPILIINCFSENDFEKPTAKADGITRCVWFSQHIGPNRGLEQVFEAAKLFPEVEFHLIGNQYSSYLDMQVLGSNIKLHAIMSQPELHAFLEKMDIGLALESATADGNRNICLTNKILAYAQAGLYILATPTDGQRQFLESLPYKAGELIAHSLGESITKLDGSCLDLPAKINRWQKAKAFSWEHEQLKLVEIF